ncbi:PPE domain-containing protein [Lentzea sp. NPDC055074]
MTQPAPSCFTEDTSRAEGFSGAEIYSQMTSGPGTGSATNAAAAATRLETSYAGIEARLKRVGETLGEAWSGASADAAQAAANPINQAMIQMQDALKQADRSISNQIHQFTLNKGQLKNMPASKPDTNLWDDATPWDTDTEDKVNSYNAEEAHNRGVYKEFQSASNTNRGELPKEFPGVLTDTLMVEIADTGGDNGEDKTSNNTTTTRSSSTSSTSSTSTPPSTTGTGWTAPTTNGDQTTTSWAGTTDTTTTSTTGKPDTVTTKPPVGSVIDRPNNTGLPPVGVPLRPTTGGPNAPSGPNGRGGVGGPGGGGPGGAGKFGGGGGGAGGAGKFGTGGLGGSATAGAAGTSAQQPGGKAGVFGGMGETAAGARGGAAGAAGRAGATGMGGMGGHGQKGQGEDDLEHRSADYLITEENTNEIIGDMPMVAPPTIGG